MKKTIAEQVNEIRNNIDYEIPDIKKIKENNQSDTSKQPIAKYGRGIVIISSLIFFFILSTLSYFMYDSIRMELSFLPKISFYNFVFIYLIFRLFTIKLF